MTIFLGHRNGEPVHIDSAVLRTHLHVIGATGKGKTTALEAMMHQLFGDHREPACHFIFDRLGGLTLSLLLWVSSRWCPPWVRERVLLIDAANEERIMPFHPLAYTTPAQGYYKVMRAVECILRGFENQNVAEMPRLWRWVFNSFWAVALLDLAVADAAHLLFPGSDYHGALLRRLPPLLQQEWAEILDPRSGAEAARVLESARNRLKPYIECPLTRSLFGSTHNRLDVARFMRENRIVLIDLSPKDRIAPQIADALGGMILNEILATARSLPPQQRTPTYLWLDEFQRFVSPDMAEAIPEVRQLNLRLILSHQSMSQLVRGDTDLTSLIWQCGSRMIFGLHGEDADVVAHELATLRYDPKKVKDQIYSLRQITERHEKISLCSQSEAEAEAGNWSNTVGSNWSAHEGGSQTDGRSGSSSRHYGPDGVVSGRASADGSIASHTKTAGTGKGGNEQQTAGGSKTNTRTTGVHEALLPVYRQFQELVQQTYYSFDEQKVLEGKAVRTKKTGQATLMIANDTEIYEVQIQRDAPGYLEMDVLSLQEKCPSAIQAVCGFLEQNFQADCFVSPAEIEAEMTDRLQQVLRPKIELRSEPETVEIPPSGGII